MAHYCSAVLCAVLVAVICSVRLEEIETKSTESTILKTLISRKPDTAEPPHQEDSPEKCYHFFVARNMSTLLSDATKMLGQVHDRAERDWILTFIHRVRSLGQHLRSHPDAHNYRCLGDDAGWQSPTFGELYFAEEEEPPFESKRDPEENQEESHTTLSDGLISSKFVPVLSTELPQADESMSDVLVHVDHTVPVHQLSQEDDSLVYQVPTHEEMPVLAFNYVHHRTEKEAKRDLITKISEQVKEFRDLGGTEDEVMNLLKGKEIDADEPRFDDLDYEELGAGELEVENSAHQPQERTVAPSPGLPPHRTADEEDEEHYETVEDDNDDDLLVKQLREERYYSTDEMKKNRAKMSSADSILVFD